MSGSHSVCVLCALSRFAVGTVPANGVCALRSSVSHSDCRSVKPRKAASSRNARSASSRVSEKEWCRPAGKRRAAYGSVPGALGGVGVRKYAMM